MTNLMPFAIAWAVLGIVVLILALMRKSAAAHEDDSIHLSVGSGATAVSEQVNTAKKLETIDKWGKILTIVLAVSGLALVVMYGLAVWEASSKVGF